MYYKHGIITSKLGPLLFARLQDSIYGFDHNVAEYAASIGADILVFCNRPWLGETQRLPLSTKMQLAFLGFTSYEDWFSSLKKATRNAIRKSSREGVEVEILDIPSDELCKEILNVFRESPFREGRYFEGYHLWNLERIRRGFSTTDYKVAAVARHDGKIVGFSRVLFREKTGNVITLNLSLGIRNSIRGPASALLASEIDYLAKKGVQYLTYGRMGVLQGLDHFRKHNGFQSIDVFYNYMPLSPRGNLFCRLGIYQPPDILVATKLGFVVRLAESLQPHLPLSVIQKFHLYA